jgi:HK97 family phage major capsid protein
MRFTVLPLVLAMVMAIANMPTNVFQICAWNHGTEKVEPWRSKLSTLPAVQRIVALGSRVREWCAELASVPLLANETGEAALDLLTAGASRLKMFRQREIDIDAEIAKLGDTLNARGITGVFTDEERTKLASLKTAKSQNAEMLAEAEAANERVRKAPVQAAPDPDDQAGKRAAQVVVGKNLAEDDPKKGFKTHRDFLAAVMNFGRGFRMDERLKPLHQKPSHDPQAAAGSDEAGVYSDPHGGFLVPEGFSPSLLQLQPEDDPTAGRTRPFPMATPVVGIPARVDKNHTTSVSGGLTVTRRPETVAATASRTEFEKVTLRATSLFGLSYATEEIMTDSPISFIAILSSGFSQEFAAKSIEEKLNGSGVGEPEGIMNSPAIVSQAKETGQAADTINYETVTNMRSRCWG